MTTELKEMIERYVPYNEQEENDKEMILEYIHTFKDVLTRENRMCHFTASNWIINKERTKVLMIYHNIYKSWAWTGGHADGDSNLLHVALKEAEEEEMLRIKEDENSGVQWIDIDKAVEVTREEKMKPIYIKLNEKLAEF